MSLGSPKLRRRLRWSTFPSAQGRGYPKERIRLPIPTANWAGCWILEWQSCQDDCNEPELAEFRMRRLVSHPWLGVNFNMLCRKRLLYSHAKAEDRLNTNCLSNESFCKSIGRQSLALCRCRHVFYLRPWRPQQILPQSISFLLSRLFSKYGSTRLALFLMMTMFYGVMVGSTMTFYVAFMICRITHF